MSELARVVEALLFLAPEPVPVDELAAAAEAEARVKGERGQRDGGGGLCRAQEHPLPLGQHRS